MKLTLRQGNSSRVIALDQGTEWLVGRDVTGVVIPIDGSETVEVVSRKHLRIERRNDLLFVRDLSSTNGSFLGENRLTPNQLYPWPEGEEVFLGPYRNISISWTSNKEDSRPPESKGAESRGLRHHFRETNEVVIGREPGLTITLPEMTVSRAHARITRQGDVFYVEDLGSTNGTFLNDTRIRQKEIFRETDTLYIGMHAFRLDQETPDPYSEAAIAAVEIGKKFRNGFVGLQPLNLKIPYKEMVALMGPSGCGKSTLMKALNGDSPPTQGHVRIFGLDLAVHFERLKHMIGYVPQENIVHEDLTVADCLFYAARLRLSRDLSREEVVKRIDEVLEAVNINSDQIKITRIGKLSGGQKKRVSIAVELLTKPRILFLDEPTSPLDPETIEDFLKCLRNLCQQGTTVVMVTHKPDDLGFADRVIFMGTGGHMTFDGKCNELLSYFRCDRLIDVYAKLSDVGMARKYFLEWYTPSPRSEPDTQAVKLERNRVNIWSQMYWLSRRYIRVKLGNRSNLAIIFLQPVLIGLLLMLTFDQLIDVIQIPAPSGTAGEDQEVGNNAILFLLAISAIWFGVSNSAKEIVGEKDILKREFMFNLRLPAYLVSKLVVLFFISAVQLLILTLMVQWRFDGFQSLLLSWTFLMLISVSAITFGLLLSVLSESTEEVMSILPIALMPQIILAGIIQKINNGLTLYMSYLTLGRWGTEGLSRIQDRGRENSIFMDGVQGLRENLYSAELDAPAWTDSLRANVLLIAVILIVMTIAMYTRLRKKLSQK